MPAPPRDPHPVVLSLNGSYAEDSELSLTGLWPLCRVHRSTFSYSAGVRLAAERGKR